MRFFILLIFTILLTGCGGSANSNNAINTKPTNINTATGNANNPLATSKTPEAATIDNAPTFAPIVQNYYAALQKKDEAGVKKHLSQTALKYCEAEAKTEKKTCFAYLLETEEPLAEKREVRNEKIDDESGVAEIKGGSLGNWTPIKFVKENGEWKFASPKESLALQDIPKTSLSPASAK